MADGITGFVELTASDVETANQLGSGPLVESKTNLWIRRVNANALKTFWPNVRLRLGGVFDVEDSAIENSVGEFDTRTSRLRPYFDLSMGNRLTDAQFNYNRDEERFGLDDGPTRKEIRESVSTVLGWYPERLPSLRFRFLRTDNRDGERQLRDTTDKRYEVSSDYQPVDGLELYYQGVRNQVNDSLNSNETEIETHTGRFDYTDDWLNGRLSLNTDYNVSHRATTTTTAGSGEVSLEVFALVGLSSLDITPDTDPLLPNPALTDGDVSAGAGINLGLTLPPDNDDPRNIGLDLAVEAEMNSLWLWVDRDLPPEVSTSFSWDIYTSEDNDEWTYSQTVMPAPFSQLVNRFEIDFDNVTTRFIKLVVNPLSPTVPEATDYATILVTELEARLRVPAEPGRRTETGTTHIYSLNFRSRLTERPLLYYELGYFLRKVLDSPARYTLSNGVSLSHKLNEVYSVAARVTYETGVDRTGDRAAWLYSASLRAAPLEKFSQRLIFSGTDELFEDDEQRTTNSIYLLSLLEPYPGIDLTLGLGKAANYETQRGRVDTTQINAGATIIPHRDVRFNLTYRDDRSDAPPSIADQSTQASQANVAYNPFVTIYLFASYRVEDRADLGHRTINNYRINWSPFPGGSLRLNFNYNETVRSDDNATDRVISPNLRWNINRRSYFDLVYQIITREATSQDLETDVLSGNLRLAF